jgi:midasin (ATPase involved in ribosome maturation)
MCFQKFHWDQMRSRSAARRCLAHAEPALLVGDTGTGKTTACQLAAAVRGQRLHILNCNLYTEASDFLGGFRPARRAPHAARVSHQPVIMYCCHVLAL